MKRFSLHSKWLVFFLLLFSLLYFAIADEKTDKVDKLFAKWDTRVSPGAALAIIKDGEIIYKRGIGMANLEHNVPINSTSVFRIGSTSKQFTAACIAILSLQGKISLDDDIRKYIPEIPKYQKPIKIKNLVHHTSGLRDYTGLLPLTGYRADADSPTIEETIEMLARQKGLDFAPGEEYSYSNSGYFLLSVIVERASGKSLNDFAQEHLFEPLGMKDTHFHDDFQMIVKNRADGYTPRGDGYRINMTNWDHVGDGGIYTTVEDFYLWDQSFYSNKLGKELVELVQTPGVLNNGEQQDYAFGLRIGKYRGLKTVGHGGSWVGFRSAAYRFPEQKFSVVCLANLSTMNPASLCMKIVDIYLTDQFKEAPEREAREPKKENAPIIFSPGELKNREGNYYDDQSGTWISVSVDGDELKVSTGNREYLLSPVSQTKFQAINAQSDISLDFSTQAEEKAQSVKLIMRGREGIFLTKIPEVAPLMLLQLKEYAGEYYCGELNTTFRLAIKEGALVFNHRNAQTRPLLEAMGSDKFVWGRNNIDFVRNKREEITGFMLRSGRAIFEFIKK